MGATWSFGIAPQMHRKQPASTAAAVATQTAQSLVAQDAAVIETEQAQPTATTSAPTEAPVPREGFIAPDFVLVVYEGRAMRLSDYRGKTVLLNFWATWCTTCAEEMPYMQHLAIEHSDDLVVLVVNQAEGSRSTQAWSNERALTALVFALDRDKSVSDAYELPAGLPHSFFIDNDGYVRVVIHGGQTYEAMQQRFAEAQSPQRAD